MDYYLSPIDFAPLFGHSTFVNYQQGACILNSWPSDLSRLRHEKEILENNLASSVIYLHALRKRQARNDRALGASPPPTRKRRKKIQQTQRELDKEIKNKQREEAALLNNLQTCRTNIYIAEGLPCTPTDPLSNVPDLTPCNTQYSCAESESTDMSWNGWTEDAIVSPFEKQSSNPFIVHEVAPDEQTEQFVHDHIPSRSTRRPPPLHSDGLFNEDLPAPPNTAQISHFHSVLSPVAEDFYPRTAQPIEDCAEVSEISPSSTNTISPDKWSRRTTDAGLQRNFQELSIEVPKTSNPNQKSTSPIDEAVDVSQDRKYSGEGQHRRRKSM